MKIGITALGILLTFLLPAQKFQDALVQWSQDSMLSSASIGFKAIRTSNGAVLGELNAHKALVPASGLKLFTTAAALHILGETKVFPTKIAYSGTIENHVLTGDIVIIGGGDPSLGSRYSTGATQVLKYWVDAVKSEGISKIEGNIIADASAFPDYTIPRTWIWEDIGNYYGCGVSGLTWRDNTFSVYFSSPHEANKPTNMVRIEPQIKNLNIDNKVLSSNLNADNAFLFGGPYNYNRLAEGTIPKGRKEFKVKGSLPDPAIQIALEFEQALIQRGISVLGNVFTNRDIRFNHQPLPTPTKEILAYTGLSVRDIVKYTNSKSVNLFAEHLACLMGQERFNAPSIEAGTRAVKQFLEEHNIPTQGVNMVDGSGLSRFNTITTQSMVALLFYMQDNSAFRSSLAVSGQSGTFKAFMSSVQASGKVEGKSGYMERVRSYHGYIEGKSGEIAFSIVVNNYDCTAGQMKKKIEYLLLELLKE